MCAKRDWLVELLFFVEVMTMAMADFASCFLLSGTRCTGLSISRLLLVINFILRIL